MMSPWPLVISLVVLAFALLIKHLFFTIIEEDNIFLGIVVAFIMVYVGAALTMGAIMPRTDATTIPVDQALSE